MRALVFALALAALAAVQTACGGGEASIPTPAANEATGAELAPEIGSISEWHNSPPLSLAALRGRTVLLVFWEDT